MYTAALLLCLLIAVEGSRPGDVSSFFLKAPKSVPRAGRAAPGQLDSFFLKASKSVPRVGRRNGANTMEAKETPYQQWLKSEYYVTQNQAENINDRAQNDAITKNMENDPLHFISSNPQMNGEVNDYMAGSPSQYEGGSISHRGRTYTILTMDPQNGNIEGVENINKEIEEPLFQTNF